MTAERRAFREHIRMQAAELFALEHDNAAIAKQLRVSVRSAQRWQQAWARGGAPAPESKGQASGPKLSEALFAVLEQELARGPVAHGWPDQTWTLARIKTLIGRRFHKSTTLSAIAQMLHRHGFSHQVPARRATERNEEGVTGWVKETWPQWKRRGGARGLAVLRRRGRLLDDAAHLRTWARRGHTPLIRVRGRSQRRFSIAALACYKQGERSRLIYRPKRHVDHKRGGRRSFTWTEYRNLLITAHQQLGAPIVLVWDNLNAHRDRRLWEFINTHDWITCHSLPAHTPGLNPVEGIWSLLRRSSQANTAFTHPDHLMSVLRHGLRQIQYRSNLIDGCLAETGLTLTTSRQQRP
ncbi:IS630 family transposase [Streptomyces monashensis]|uniref:IS630 family transposase n=1 Tax=Streptomyces monashensis TaxID=1678012 RepID=UPI003CCC2FAB